MEASGLLLLGRTFGLLEPCFLVRELPEKLGGVSFPTGWYIRSLLWGRVSCLAPPKVEVGHRVHFTFPVCSLASGAPCQYQQPLSGVEGQCWRKDNKSQLEPLFFKNAHSA